MTQLIAVMLYYLQTRLRQMHATQMFHSLFSARHPLPIQTALLTAARPGKLLMTAAIQHSAHSASILIHVLNCSAPIHRASGVTQADMIVLATANHSL